jgi:nucleoside-diphosphate-sugar epimerase
MLSHPISRCGFAAVLLSFSWGTHFAKSKGLVDERRPVGAATAMAVPSPGRSSRLQGDCAVVGVGVLGTNLCRQLLQDSEISVTGITRSPERHETIRNLVFNRDDQDRSNSERFRLVTFDQFNGPQERRFQNVVFCAPPSGFEDYPAAVRDVASNLWAGPEAGGSFVFTSSGAVYGPGLGAANSVTESSPTADPDSGPRVQRLLSAEKACLDAGGCCLRLAGLYNLDRGAHNFWLTSGKPISGSADGIVNLLHYDDAAGACFAALKAGAEVCAGRAFLISDGHPLTRQQICESAVKARMYSQCAIPEFVNTDQPGVLALGKIYDGSWSNKQLEWMPAVASFDSFMTSQA